jgi:hypothetical protein
MLIVFVIVTIGYVPVLLRLNVTTINYALAFLVLSVRLHFTKMRISTFILPTAGLAIASSKRALISPYITSAFSTIVYVALAHESNVPDKTLDRRQQDGMWTPDATFAVPSSPPTAPAWSPLLPPSPPQPTGGGYNFEDGKYGMAIAFGVIGGFIVLSLLGCTFFAYKQRKCCFGRGTQQRGIPDIEAGHRGFTSPSRAVVNPGAYPEH